MKRALAAIAAAAALIAATAPPNRVPAISACRSTACPGALNAITDVRGVAVGQVTLIGDVPGDVRRKIRTGVTAILPRGHDSLNIPVFGAAYALNGNGEMTGTAWLAESGQLEGPVVLTNTHSVGVARDAVIAWRVKRRRPIPAAIGGRCRWWPKPGTAISTTSTDFTFAPSTCGARSTKRRTGPVAEGNVGGGTGMICHEFKCGIGTASRVIAEGGR